MKRNILNLVKTAYSLYIKGVSIISPDTAGKIAFKLFKKPRGKKLTDNQIQWLTDRKAGLVKIETQNLIYYRIPGKGTKILLAHGWESNAYRWRKYVELLSALDYDIFLLDAPGHGLSRGYEFTPLLYGSGINSLCNKYKIEIIIGHSVGGYATIFAVGEMDMPSSVNNIILLAPTVKLKKMMTQFYQALDLNSKTIKSYEALFLKSYGHNYDYFNGDKMMKNAKVKGLLIHDKNDKILPHEYSYDLDKSWPSGELIITEGNGHRLLSQEITQLVFDYLKRQ